MTSSVWPRGVTHFGVGFSQLCEQCKRYNLSELIDSILKGVDLLCCDHYNLRLPAIADFEFSFADKYFDA